MNDKKLALKTKKLLEAAQRGIDDPSLSWKEKRKAIEESRFYRRELNNIRQRIQKAKAIK